MKRYILIPSVAAYGAEIGSYSRLSRCILSANVCTLEQASLASEESSSIFHLCFHVYLENSIQHSNAITMYGNPAFRRLGFARQLQCTFKQHNYSTDQPVKN